jgi:hypothetical protein
MAVIEGTTTYRVPSLKVSKPRLNPPPTDPLSRVQRTEANRYAALSYYHSGVTTGGFRPLAPSVSGVAPQWLPSRGVADWARLTNYGRMRLASGVLYEGVPQSVTASLTGNPEALGSAGRASISISQQGIPKGLEGTLYERLAHETEHFLEPSNLPSRNGFMPVLTQSGIRVLSPQDPRELYANLTSRTLRGAPLPPAFLPFYPQYRY